MTDPCRPAKLILMLLPGLFAAGAAAEPLSPRLDCLLTHCGKQTAACELETDCRQALDCVRGCDQADPELRQACIITCTESHAAPRYDELTACLVENDCMPKAQSAGCVPPPRVAALAKLTPAELGGTWTVVRGLSKAYDCWSCQRMRFRALDADHASYDYDYQVAPGRLSHAQCQVQTVAPTPGAAPLVGRLQVDYHLHGMSGKDDWYVLSHPHPDFALVYYCGTNAVDRYRGAVVMSRSGAPELPQGVEAAFRQALDEAGLSPGLALSDFCTNDNSACSD